MKARAIFRRCCAAAAAAMAWCVAPAADAQKPPVQPFETAAPLASQGEIDRLVFASWQRLGIRPAYSASDAVFLRRAYLDAIGTLPMPEEAAEFLASTDPNKRSALVDRLLERPEFADYWAMKWSDLLRVKSEFPINLWPNAVQAYYRWIHTAVRDNMPYDRFVRALLVSNGSNFRAPEANFYRATPARDAQTLAKAVAQTFMGERTDAWPKARRDGMAAFFSQVAYKSTSEWKEEIVTFDPEKKMLGPAVFPDGKPAKIAFGQDPRAVFATWLISPENQWFGRNIVNRIWCWLMGRGIIHEADDIRLDNPPSNPELLTYLERELISSQYDLKHIFKLILASQTYQMSGVQESLDPAMARQFAYYPVRRLDAETLIDAICQITGSPEEYSSPIPEPFTYLPGDQRSIALPDGSITSAFLILFGRSPRDSGLESERNNAVTAEQRLHMLNSSHIQAKLQQSDRLRALVQPGARPRDPIDRLYLAILSRYPTDDELKSVSAYFQANGSNRWQAIVDISWALINSAEFLCRH